ncbi:MAG: DUF971 domain-containing protein [Fimbriimonadaceae bacterium]|nr:DUF971 domain-containing protein [Fimbriimonadaceae bacterium]
MSSASYPVDLAVSRQQGTCTITWQDQRVAVLALLDLRKLCPCATCNEQRANTSPLQVFSGPLPTAELQALEAVGGYAVRFRWADGHDAGIYSFTYLRELCERQGWAS